MNGMKNSEAVRKTVVAQPVLNIMLGLVRPVHVDPCEPILQEIALYRSKARLAASLAEKVKFLELLKDAETRLRAARLNV